AGHRLRDVGPARAERPRPFLFLADDKRRRDMGAGASDLRSGRAQSDAQQPDRRLRPGRRAITVFDIFTEFDVDQNNAITTHLSLVQSTDRGVTWSGPTVISSLRAVGTRDPQNFARELRDGANIAQFASGPDGALVGVWQDSRFSGGARDGIAFSRSTDQGRTWSAPVQINRVPGVAAFLPAISFRSDGALGVLYDDMRNDTADASTLLVDTWLATSQDGVTWSERHVLGPFDFNLAPVAEGGLFVGDYQGLASGGGVFVSFFAQTNPVH